MDRALCEPDFVEQGERAIAEIRIADAGRGELRLDVLDRGQRRDQIELLEDEAERAQAELRELVVGQRREVAALEEHVAGARPVERAEQLQERRLAASARSLERDELAGFDLEVDAVERAHRGRAALEELRHAVELNRAPSLHLPQRVGGAKAGCAERGRRAGDQAAQEREARSRSRGSRRRSAR